MAFPSAKRPFSTVPWRSFQSSVTTHSQLAVSRRYSVSGTYHAALFRVVVGQTVPLVCQLFAASVGGSGYGGFAFSPADDLDAAMVDCDGITSVSLVRT